MVQAWAQVTLIDTDFVLTTKTQRTGVKLIGKKSRKMIEKKSDLG
jgi:hypothetical protein